MPRGDCYEVHLNILRDELDEEERDEWRLCHGLVTNAAGKEIGHCWLEHHGFAHDFSNGNYFQLPVDEFRRITKARNVTSYSSEEVSVNLIKYRHCGPWP